MGPLVEPDHHLASMQVSIGRLQQARALLLNGQRLTGETGFLATIGALCGKVPAEPTPPADATAKSVYDALRYADWELSWTVETLMRRLDWQWELWMRLQLDDLRCAAYVSADIALFHVAYRSIFDHLARVLVAIAAEPGQVCNGSFRALLNSIDPEDPASIPDNDRKVATQRRKCGADVEALLLEAAPWFRLMRKVRDGIVHHGQTVFVSRRDTSILFNCPGRVTARLPAPLIVDGHWVDFELYGGVMYAYLLAYLEHIGDTLWGKLDVLKQVNKERSHRAKRVYSREPSEEERRRMESPASATDMSAGASSRWIDKAIQALGQGPSTQDSAPNGGTT